MSIRGKTTPVAKGSRALGNQLDQCSVQVDESLLRNSDT